ncbi:NAD(P)/FAD-dependent oxidoreductase [Streptomyces sp. P1-3]|uniref:NAD(P)/FAD-dependent oxidoreductase n=1 Tax=Streptomyces sp. P1-3 TaxID=3421658 RepID=UPI003D35ED11
MITRSELDHNEARKWRSSAGSGPLVVIVIGTRKADRAGESCASPGAESTAAATADTGLVYRRVVAGAEPDRELYQSALALAERTWLTAVAGPALAGRLAGVRARGRSVALVGAGVVNLITALRLLRDGYEVAVYDASPDPRNAAPWTAYGCSRGGGDARMFTLTEADGYHWPPGSGPVPFHRPVKESGWRIATPATLSAQDLDWAEDSAGIPPWLARSYTEDVLLFNQVARDLWRELAWREPALFDDVGLREGILRLYTDPNRLRAQVARQRRLGAARAVLSPDEVAERYPALRDACAARALAGGIEVVGFTVQVHRFLAALADLLEQAGARLHWDCPVTGLSRDAHGLPDGLIRAGGRVRADHYVLSPGAYGGQLLRGTVSQGLIHGVLGAWLSLPNPAPRLENSLKISFSGHIAEDANVTVVTAPNGESRLVVGSGYGWTGSDPENIDPGELDALYGAIEDTAARFFPGPFEEARDAGLAKENRKHCVRPWTASSLPVLEIANAAGGLLVVTGGHNTGGFAQAPAVAQAVADALAGQAHPMHVRYHPDRLRLFYRHR